MKLSNWTMLIGKGWRASFPECPFPPFYIYEGGDEMLEIPCQRCGRMMQLQGIASGTTVIYFCSNCLMMATYDYRPEQLEAMLRAWLHGGAIIIHWHRK